MPSKKHYEISEMASEGEGEERRGEVDEFNPPGEVTGDDDSGGVSEEGRSSDKFD